MATSEQKVKAVHPRAAKRRYSKNGGGSYVLIWSGYPEGRESVRLGNGKTASEAWADAAKNTERAAAQTPTE
ncbi:hypothetical protein [Pseudomonas sp. NPDC089569]|uniref:hypothetical protein n=1 Tax=Pseudomonas sp. NPDC089569 TaxID=3390722 RepID=UPI003CFFAEC2